MSDFKETCIWMSYRYAIGRKSIASVMHAEDIAKHLDWISEDRKEFTAQDILKEVNDKVNWIDNIHLEFYGMEKSDVFTPIFEWFMNNPKEDPIKYFMEHEWFVDLRTNTLEIKERENPPQRNEHNFYSRPDIFTEYSDYKNWVNLAKYIKGATHIATVNYDNCIRKIPVIEWYDVCTAGGKVTIEKHYSNAEDFPKWFLAPEFIIEIKKN